MDYEIHAAPWEVHFDMTQLLHTYPQEFFSYMTYDLVIGVLGGGALAPPWQKYLAWQNRIGWLGRKEIDTLAEKNWKA